MAHQEQQRLEEAISDIRRFKLKDVQLDPFAGTEKEWRSFKISLNCTLTDFELEEVMEGNEEFPFPDDPENPTAEETLRIRLWTTKDRTCKKILLKFCKGSALAIVTAGPLDEKAADAWTRLVSRYEGNKRAREHALLSRLHEP